MIEIRHPKMNSTQDTKAAYDVIYNNYGILQSDSFYLWLISLLKPDINKKLIDISCGEGRLLSLTKSEIKTYGIDFSIKGLLIGKRDNSTTNWILGDAENLPLASESFDYVFNIGSLEHYQSPLSGVLETARILKSSGKAAILLPNSFGWWGNIKNVLLHGEVFDDFQPIQRYGTRRTWEQLLNLGGLSIIKSYKYNEINFPKRKKDLYWIVKHPFRIARGLLGVFVPLNLANHFVFICTKK